jgi:hypothetical protein
MSSNIYRMLPARTIRLIELLPADTLGSTLRCRIHNTSLDAEHEDRISFEALSYVWGERVGTRPIFCGDKSILVTPNCEAALRHLREELKSRLLWIDAICINQSQDKFATQERNQQVKMMGEVYAIATKVLIWLGECPDISGLFLGKSTLAALVAPPSAMNPSNTGGIFRIYEALDEMKQFMFFDADLLELKELIQADPHVLEGEQFSAGEFLSPNSSLFRN